MISNLVHHQVHLLILPPTECLSKAYPFKRTDGGDQWINELLWREFYVDIIVNFPECATEEFLEKYRGKIKWKKNQAAFEQFCEGRTGFPIVDASIRQLLQGLYYE